MIINKLPIRYNYSRRLNEMRYIVVHDTGNPRRGAGALSHYRYFNGGYRAASAHFFVDDRNVVETVDPHLVSWHCGDGKGRYGITNSNSIGIEICINEDSDFEKAKAQARELIKFLCQTYRIPKKNVVRHYDASRKICPGRMARDNWKEWKEFWDSI